MKALTIRQPWATLIALGVKTIETRSWRAPQALIGQRIAIHAGKHEAAQLPESARPMLVTPKVYGSQRSLDRCLAPSGLLGEWVPLPLGVVVAIATLADCVPMVERDTGINIARYVYLLDDEVLHVNQTRSPRVTEMSDQLPYGDFRPGRWAWMLTDIEQLADPIPATGKQGVWEWTP